VPVADQPLLAVGAQLGAGTARRLGLCGGWHGCKPVGHAEEAKFGGELGGVPGVAASRIGFGEFEVAFGLPCPRAESPVRGQALLQPVPCLPGAAQRFGDDAGPVCVGADEADERTLPVWEGFGLTETYIPFFSLMSYGRLCDRHPQVTRVRLSLQPAQMGCTHEHQDPQGRGSEGHLPDPGHCRQRL